MEALKNREEKRNSRKRIAVKPASSTSLHLSHHQDAHPYQRKSQRAQQKASCVGKAQISKKDSMHCSGLAGSHDQREVKDLRLKTPKQTKIKANQECKADLEMDVKRLKKRLTHEMDLHKALERAFHRPFGALPRVPHYLPSETQELIAEVAVLEEEIVNLEGQFLTLQQNLYNEAICISAFKKQEQSTNVPKKYHLEELNSKKTQSSTASFPGIRDNVVTRLLSSTKETDNIDSARPMENKCFDDKSAIIGSKYTEPSLSKTERFDIEKAAALDSVRLPPPCKDTVVEAVIETTQTNQWELLNSSEKPESHPMMSNVARQAGVGNMGLPSDFSWVENEESLQRTLVNNFPAAQKEERTVSEELAESLSNFRLNPRELPSRVVAQKFLNSRILLPDQKTEANKLSEETMKCLLNIYITMTRPYSMCDSDSLSNLSLSTFSSFSSHSCGSKSSCSTKYTSGTSDEPSMPDPYGVCGSVPHDVGPYKQFQDISAASFDYGRIADCASNLRRLRDMIGKLAKVDLRDMSHHEKLAFWINIYNACMMHAFLEYGIPCSSNQVISLLHKAELNVGGHLLNVPTIERMLCLPTHSNQPCTSKEMARMQHSLGLEWPEPQVIFALCCGTRSSPAVRVYTAAEVDDELELAKREYLHASIGFTSKQNLLIPKLLEWNLSMFAKDAESLLDWLSLQLPKALQAHVKECLEKANGMVSRVLQVMPYEFTFRYLVP